ncbi:MAG: hypothetical protein HYX52_05625 [Chloroflexi bacterium]|nr:hypothetical protein [Chloroflexota bacterium]
MTSSSIPPYPSIYALGHPAIKGLFDTPVLIEEKVDGSQLSFLRTADGVTHVRSKGKDQTEDTDGLFRRAVEVVRGLDLTPGWVYRAEYLERPKHNTLAYSDIPRNHLALFDVEVPNDMGGWDFMAYREKAAAAHWLGISVAPALFEGQLNGQELTTLLGSLLQTKSFLGGPPIEGVVIKNYAFHTRYDRIGLAKHVSEAFKESHKADWGTRHPSRGDLVANLATAYRTEARWQKAVQHLREDGALVGDPRDIGPLIKAVLQDVRNECADEIKEALFEHCWRDIGRGLTTGLPEWYKQKIFEDATL